MANVATKRKRRGKSDHDGTSRRGHSARGTAAAEFPEEPLVVTPEAASRGRRVLTPSSLEPTPRNLSTPEAALRGRVSTPSSLKPTPRNLSSQLTTQGANLSTAL